jgi:hypothetical protein
MPDQRPESQRNLPRIRRGSEVITKDGPGKVMGMELRKNTNGGPGAWQYRVRLEDGRVRHYGSNAVASP